MCGGGGGGVEGGGGRILPGTPNITCKCLY